MPERQELVFVREPTDAERTKDWHTTIPVGYRLAWTTSPLEWAIIGTDVPWRPLKCRHSVRNPCPAEPVVILWRKRHGFGPDARTTTTAWAYCEEHMYGNKIEDGKVIGLRLIPEGPAQ